MWIIDEITYLDIIASIFKNKLVFKDDEEFLDSKKKCKGIFRSSHGFGDFEDFLSFDWFNKTICMVAQQN